MTDAREVIGKAVKIIGPHDDIQAMRAYLYDTGQIEAFEAYRLAQGKERTLPPISERHGRGDAGGTKPVEHVNP